MAKKPPKDCTNIIGELIDRLHRLERGNAEILPFPTPDEQRAALVLEVKAMSPEEALKGLYAEGFSKSDVRKMLEGPAPQHKPEINEP